MADATDDHEVESRFSSVADTVFRGRDGVVSWWRDLEEAWDPIKVELEGSRDVDPAETVLLLALHGRGRGSGVLLDESVGLRWHWNGDRLQRMSYMDRHEAELIVSGGVEA